MAMDARTLLRICPLTPPLLPFGFRSRAWSDRVFPVLQMPKTFRLTYEGETTDMYILDPLVGEFLVIRHPCVFFTQREYAIKHVPRGWELMKLLAEENPSRPTLVVITRLGKPAGFFTSRNGYAAARWWLFLSVGMSSI